MIWSFDVRSPSQVTSGDSGITGSSGLTASSMSREMWLSSQYAGPDDVPCHMCRGQKLKALKSCLTCVRSFCEIHARAHYLSQELEQHQLVEVTEDLDIYKENAQLKEMINKMHEENRALREELRSLRMSSSTPSLPACICKGKTPTAGEREMIEYRLHTERNKSGWMMKELLSSQPMWFWILRRLTAHSSSPRTVNECDWAKNVKSSPGLRGSTGGSVRSLKPASAPGDITGRYVHTWAHNYYSSQSLRDWIQKDSCSQTSYFIQTSCSICVENLRRVSKWSDIPWVSPKNSNKNTR